MTNQAQISAMVSTTTKDKLDRFTMSHGLKKNYVIEQSLLYFMEARRDLPEDAFVPTRIVLEKESFDSLVERLENPKSPTEALRELMRGS